MPWSGLPNLGVSCFLNAGLKLLAASLWPDNLCDLRKTVAPQTLSALQQLVNTIRAGKNVSTQLMLHFVNTVRRDDALAKPGEGLLEFQKIVQSCSVHQEDVAEFFTGVSQLYDRDNVGLQRKCFRNPAGALECDNRFLIDLAELPQQRTTSSSVSLQVVLNKTFAKDYLVAPGDAPEQVVLLVPRGTLLWQKVLTKLTFDAVTSYLLPFVMVAKPLNKILTKNDPAILQREHEREEVPYHVHAASYHAGDTLTSGHYFTRIYADGKWWLHDDQRVVQEDQWSPHSGTVRILILQRTHKNDVVTTNINIDDDNDVVDDGGIRGLPVPIPSRSMLVQQYLTHIEINKWRNKAFVEKRGEFRVVTWNLSGMTDVLGVTSLQRVLSALFTLNADVLCLQECPSTKKVLNAIAKLGYSHRRLCKSLVPRRMGTTTLANVIFSKQAIVGKKLIKFGSDNCAVLAMVQLPARGRRATMKLVFTSMHLPVGDEKLRVRYIRKYIAELDKYALPGSSFVAGDMNALTRMHYTVPQWELMMRVNRARGVQPPFSNAMQLWKTSGYTDAFSSNPPRSTVWSERIVDYVLLDYHGNKKFLVRQAGVYFTAASDHLPVVVDLSSSSSSSSS